MFHQAVSKEKEKRRKEKVKRRTNTTFVKNLSSVGAKAELTGSLEKMQTNDVSRGNGEGADNGRWTRRTMERNTVIRAEWADAGGKRAARVGK